MAGRTPFLVKASEKSTRSVMPGAPGEVAVCVCAGACVCVCGCVIQMGSWVADWSRRFLSRCE